MLSKFLFRVDNRVLKIVLTIAVFLLTFKEVGEPVNTGLDYSWIFGINYFFHNSIQFGVEVLFTLGPLGFLLNTLPIGNNFEIALVFWSAVQLIFIWLLLTLVLAFHKESPLWVKIAIIPLSLVLVNSLIFDSLLIFLVFVAALLYIHENKIVYFILSVFVGTAALLIKFSIAIMGFIFLGSVILAVKRKLRSFLKLISLGVFTISVTFTSIWLLLYGNLEGALAFFLG